MYCMLASKEMVLPLTALSTEQEQKLKLFLCIKHSTYQWLSLSGPIKVMQVHTYH